MQHKNRKQRQTQSAALSRGAIHTRARLNRNRNKTTQNGFVLQMMRIMGSGSCSMLFNYVCSCLSRSPQIPSMIPSTARPIWCISVRWWPCSRPLIPCWASWRLDFFLRWYRWSKRNSHWRHFSTSENCDKCDYVAFTSIINKIMEFMDIWSLHLYVKVVFEGKETW